MFGQQWSRLRSPGLCPAKDINTRKIDLFTTEDNNGDIVRCDEEADGRDDPEHAEADAIDEHTQ